MKREEANQWIEKSKKRKQLLLNIKQPMTALQLSRQAGISLNQCSSLIGQFGLCNLVKCLNPSAKRSRIYWLTPIGILCQKKMYKDQHLPAIAQNLLEIDWQLYGWICFNHRAAIIKALTEPMQPAAIKRRVIRQNSRIKMSANNARDVIRLLVQKKIVKPVKVRKKVHPQYELTEIGTKLRKLLLQAETGILIQENDI